MIERFRNLPEDRQADVIIGSGIFLILVVGLLLAGTPAWIAVAFSACTGPGTAYILRSSSISLDGSASPARPRSVRDAIRLVTVALLLALIAGAVLFILLARNL